MHNQARQHLKQGSARMNRRLKDRMPRDLPKSPIPKGYPVDPHYPFDPEQSSERLKKLLEQAAQAQRDALDQLPPANYSPDPTGHIESDIEDFFATNKKNLRYNFVPQHCEALLNGALELLQRCLFERSAYDALREAWQDRWLSLEEMRRTQEIAKAELEGGAADLIWLDDEAARLSNETSKQAANTKIAQIEAALGNESYKEPVVTNLAKDATPNDPNKNAAGSLAALEVRRQALGLETSKLEAQTYVTPTNGAEKSIADQLADIHAKKVRFGQTTQKNSYLSRLTLMTDMLAAKLDAFQGFGAPHNYVEQLDAVRNRFIRDLAEVSARLEIASKGMSILYGFKADVPRIEDCIKNGARLLDSYLAYTRNAIRTINQVTAIEKHSVFTVFVKIPKKAPAKKLFGCSGRMVEFTLPDGMYEAMYYARIRNICAYASFKEECAGVFQVGLVPPEVGKFRRFADVKRKYPPIGRVTPSGRIVFDDARPWLSEKDDMEFDIPVDAALSQADIGVFMLGRVTDRYASSPPASMVNGELYNVSPFGEGDQKWCLFISDESSQGESTSSALNGIEIDFTIAYRSI